MVSATKYIWLRLICGELKSSYRKGVKKPYNRRKPKQKGAGRFHDISGGQHRRAEESRHPRQAGAGGREAEFLRKESRGEKVQDTEGSGLSNVKAVADKYGGDFAVSCDAEKLQAVVML